jgi:hypothetical protein
MILRPSPKRPARQRMPGPARRDPVDWRTYAARARRAEERVSRRAPPLLLTLGASVIFTVAGALLLQLVGVGLGAGVAGLGRSVIAAIPQPTQADLVLGETTVNVTAAPVLDPLPDYTKTPQLALSGKVPTFAVASGRAVAIAVNGTAIGAASIGSDGRFGPVSLTLIDGTNNIKATLVDGPMEIAATSATVVVQRTPPPLTVTRPSAGDTLSGDVVVEGKTSSGSSVILNDRVLRPNPDGSFTDSIASPSPGPLTITVVATDRAGNETTTRIDVTVKPSPSPSAAGTTLQISLDRTTVRPGETVVATIAAIEGGKPKADLAVTLQVGVIPIGTYKTDATGVARVGFAAPDHEVAAAAVVVLGGGTSATTTLTVAKQ